MIVNLNVMCKVQLNELGKEIWLSQIKNLPEDITNSHPEIIQAIIEKIDKDNCVECELWAIMSIFGPFISQTQNPFTRTTIEINKNPNFGNYFTTEQVDKV